MRDYSRPTRGRGGRPYWRGRGDYHHQGSYHDRYSSSHRPSHSSRYDYDRSRDRRDRRDDHSHRDRRSYSNDRRGRSRSRSRSRSPRRRYSREKTKYSRSRSRSPSYSSRSRSSSRGRSSRSRSHSQSHHRSRHDSKESHTMKQVGSEPQSAKVSVTTGNASSSQNTVLEKQEHSGTSSNILAGNRNLASIPTNMTTTIPAPAVVTIPPPSRWETDGSPDVNFQSKISKEYEESVSELYAGITEPSLDKDPKYGSSKLKELNLAPMEKMSPVNLQKKSLVITFSNDRFQNSSAVAPKKAASGEELASNQSTFETAVTPPRVSEDDNPPPPLPATSGTAAQKSLFPAANRPMWKPVGEVDLPSPLITESQSQASGTTQKKVAGTTEGTNKKKSKEDLQKEIRELELALEKKRNAKKASSEEVQLGEKDTSKDGKRGRSRSRGSESSRSSSGSSSESSRERESRRRNSRGRGDRGKKKYNDKDKYRKEHVSEDRYNEREQSKYENRDKEKLRRSREYDDSAERRSGKHRRERSERDEGQSDKRRKHGEGNDQSDTNEPEGALHASLLSASEENMETNKADKNDHESSIEPVLPFMTSQSIQPSSGINFSNLSSRMTASTAESQSDVLAVDHFLQSLGLPSSTTAASTSTQVSYSLPPTGQMSSYPDERKRSHPPGLSSTFSEEMDARDKASLRDQFGFPYQYQEGQSLPGLDLHESPSTLPAAPAPAPSGGFQNADEEDEYLYGPVSSEKNEPDQDKVEEQNKVEEYVPEEKPPEKGEKDEQLNKILSAIGFDFDMAKQIVEQTKRKEEQIKEQSQKKGARKGKKVEEVSDPPVTSETKQQRDDHKAEIAGAKTNTESQESKQIEKDVGSIAAQPIPRLVRRTIDPDESFSGPTDASQNQNSNEWSNQYYGPTASSSYYPSTTNSAPVSTGAYGQVETQYGPPAPVVASAGGAPPLPPTHGPLAPPTHGPPVPPSHGPPVPPSHGPPVPPSHGPPAPPSHGPPVPPSHGPPVPSSLPPGVPVAPHGPNPPSQGPPVPPQGPPPGLPPQYGPGYDNYSQAPYPHQWQDSYGYEQMHQPDGGYYRRSPSPGYSSQGRYSRSLSQSPSRSRSFSRSRSPSPGRSFSSSTGRSPGRSPYASRPPKRKKKQKKYKSKMPESDGEHSEKYMKKKKKKTAVSGSRDRPKDVKKSHEGEKHVSKEGDDSKERGSVSGIKVSLSRDQNEESSRRVITMPKAKSRSRSPEKKSKRKGRTSTQEEKEEVQAKEKVKVQDAGLLIKQQEKLLIERMEKKKREMEKELEKEKNKKEQELQNLDYEFQKREREIKKREEIIMRVEEKLRKEQDKRVAEEKKMEQEQQRKLKKEKEDYKKRLQFLQKELDRLKRNQGEMLRKKQKEKDGHKDPELMENNQQQEEILTQIKRLKHAYSEAYGKPLPEEPDADEEDRSRHSRESSSRERSSSKSKRSEDSRESRHSSERGRTRESEKELSEGKSRFNFIYFDSCDHWCSCCNKTLRNINEFFLHLHSKNHMKKCDPHDRPWKALTQQKQQPSQTSSSSSSSIQAPFKGSELFVPTNAFYCRLCKMFLGDVVCASEHIRQRSHNLKYQKFTEDNPFYEKQRNVQRAAKDTFNSSSPEPDQEEGKEPEKEEKETADNSQQKEKKVAEEDTEQPKKKLSYVGKRPGFSKVPVSKLEVKEESAAKEKPHPPPPPPHPPPPRQELNPMPEVKPAAKLETVEGKSEETATEKEAEDGKKDSRFKFKFTTGKKLKAASSSTATTSATTQSSSTVTAPVTSAAPVVTGVKSFPMIGKRSKSKLVLPKPEPEPEPKSDQAEKYEEMKNSLDLFLQMKSGAVPVVSEEEKKEKASKTIEKAATAPPLPVSASALTSQVSADPHGGNKNDIAKAYENIAAKEKAAEKQAELMIQPPLPSINPPLPPEPFPQAAVSAAPPPPSNTGVSEVIKKTLNMYSSAHLYKAEPPRPVGPVINTSMPPPPPPNFMVNTPLLANPPLLPNPPPPGTQSDQQQEKDGEMQDILAEYGELLPDDDDSGEPDPPGEEKKQEETGKEGSSGSDLENEYMYWY